MFRGCLNATDRSVFSLPKSYLFSPAPPQGLFALDVAPSVNVTLLLNETVLSVGAATAFFFASTPVAIGVRQTSTTAKPAVTVRACSCDGNSAVFSSALLNSSDSLVALTVNASLALQTSLQQGRRVRGVFCAPAKHHYAVGVRAGTVVVKFDRLAIFGTAAAKPVVPQPALSLYLVSASGRRGGDLARCRAQHERADAPARRAAEPCAGASRRSCARAGGVGAAHVLDLLHARRLPYGRRLDADAGGRRADRQQLVTCWRPRRVCGTGASRQLYADG
jgi:hypothetical protein